MLLEILGIHINVPENVIVEHIHEDARVVFIEEVKEPLFYYRSFQYIKNYYIADAHPNDHRSRAEKGKTKGRRLGLEEAGWIGNAPILVSESSELAAGDYGWNNDQGMIRIKVPEQAVKDGFIKVLHTSNKFSFDKLEIISSVVENLHEHLQKL